MFTNLVRTGLVTCHNQLMRLPPRLVLADTNRFISSDNTITTDEINKEDEGDTFGTIETKWDEKVASDFIFEEDDNDAQDEHERKRGDIYRPGKEDFLRKINHLVHEKRDLKSALEVLDIEMKDEYVQPQFNHYRVLIHACAQAGYTTKAFKLHKEYKERGLQPHVAIYTDLFSACTKSHDRDFALSKANHLLNELREKHFNPNQPLYHSMIQAFGRLGDIATAFTLVDEMKVFKFQLTCRTYNTILQGCISNKESGFRHALIVWRNMRRKGIAPDLFSYNLMLRCTKECGLGDPTLLQDILLESVSKQERKFLEARMSGQLLNQKSIGQTKNPPSNQNLEKSNSELVNMEESGKKWWEVDIKQLEKSYQNMQSESPSTPSILELKPELGNVLKLDLEDTIEGRMMLIGSMDQIVGCMASDKIVPDMKTMSILLNTINTQAMEKQVFKIMEQLKLKPDTAFFNQVIKGRALRKDYKEGIQGLEEMAGYGLSPDIFTFGCVAMCCDTRKTGLHLLKDMHQIGAKPNVEIMGVLLSNAMTKLNLSNVTLYLEISQQQRVPVNARFLNKVENFHEKYRSWIKTKEEGGYVPYEVVLEIKESKLSNWRKFSKFYSEWLKSVQFDGVVDPTLQYRNKKDIKDEEKIKSRHSKPQLRKLS